MKKINLCGRTKSIASDVAGYTDTETKAVCNKNHITYNKNKKKNMKALKTNKGK